jgi:hypothetical protein
MRLLRVALTDVRGVASSEVRFARDGVTVVEAPNESGKSTLLEAVDVLLEYKDSSKAQRVKDLQPADRDVPSTIEVELTCGPYHLTCTKTYNHRPGTVLTIHAPQQETLRGTDAHDHLRAILESDVDLALYQALRFTQGRDLEAVAFGGSDVLAARLDAAAGGAGAPDDRGLLERATAEYGRWFTPTGLPGQALRAAEQELAEAEERHAAFAARVTELQQDVDELAQLERELPALHRQRTEELAPQLAAARDAVARVREARAAVGTRQAEQASATAARAAADDAVARRRALVASVEGIRTQLAAAAADLVPARERLRELEATRETVEGDLVAALDAAERERRRADQAQLLVDLLEARRERDRLAGQQQRVTELVEQARDAELALAELRLDDARLEEIRSASEALRVAQAALAAGAPTVELLAHRDLELVVDGRTVTVPAGGMLQHTVGEQLALAVPQVADLEVRAGTSADELQQAVAAAEVRLRTACEAAGVEDADRAEVVAETRRQHLAVLARRDAELARELDGRSPEQLVRELQAAEDRLRGLEARCPDGTPADHALPAARDELAAGKAAAEDASAALMAARTARDRLAGTVHEQRTRVGVTEARHRSCEEELARAEQQLGEQRATCDDDALAAAAAAAAAAEQAADAALAAADAELRSMDATAVERDAAVLVAQLEELQQRIGEREQRQAALRERLRLSGEEGLGERLQDAEDRRLRAQLDHRRTTARAAAARLLLEELTRAREEAYERYRAPLRDRITEQARLLFEAEVGIELDEELRIVGRTLAGVTLPWDQLSAGAREQLAILAGLAAAQLAGEDGVPFVLDDALGYTDPARLERFGKVLGRATGAQVIVLTCVAERFRSVDAAATVRLREGSVAAVEPEREPALVGVAAPVRAAEPVDQRSEPGSRPSSAPERRVGRRSAAATAERRRRQPVPAGVGEASPLQLDLDTA